MKPIYLHLLSTLLLLGFAQSSSACDAEIPANIDTESEAFQTVIDNDSFCCDVQWDNICQNAFDEANGSVGGSDPDQNDGDNNDSECLTPPEDVDTNSEAYLAVIANDSFCCDVYWDNLCQNAYDINNGSEPENGGGNWGGGNNDGECATPPANVDTSSDAYANVIANDSFCCNVQWDAICDNDYNDYLAPSDCVSPGAGVDINSSAYLEVIQNDLFCCEVQWDGVCQNYYDDLTGPSDCVEPNENIDTNSEAYATVIANDSFCCDFQWDIICQNAYDNLTGGGSDDGEDDDDGDDDGNGTNDDECAAAPSDVDTTSEAYATVIANDSFCCDVQWDNLCQNAYDNLTGNDDEEENEENENSCITPPNYVDVNSEAYLNVIENDTFCCEFFWDTICDEAYNDSLTPDDCVEPGEGVDVNSAAYAEVIATDSFCCDVQWDAICQNYYDEFNGPSECAQPFEGVDTNSEAYATVIANDSFCCDVQWDNICQNAYDGLTGGNGEDNNGDDDENGNSTNCSAEIPSDVDVTSEAFANTIAADSFCCNTSWDILCQDAYEGYLGEGIVIPQDPFAAEMSSLDINVFPNPTNGITQIVFNGFSVEDAYMIRVHNANGQLVYEENVPAEAIHYRTEIDLSFASSGVYIVSAFGTKQHVSKRLILLD